MFKRLYLSYVHLNHPGRQVRESEVDVKFFRLILLRLIARIVLCCYALMMFRTAMPVVTDFLAHNLWKEHHIATVHKHNGKAHVHLEEKKVTDGSEKDKTSGKVKYEVNDIAYILPENDFTFDTWHYIKMAFFDLAKPYPASYVEPDYIPPRG